MELYYGNYIIEEEKGRFNLYEKREKSNIVIGYGYTFERMLRRLTHELVAKKDITTIRGYIDEFKCVLDEIENTLK